MGMNGDHAYMVAEDPDAREKILQACRSAGRTRQQAWLYLQRSPANLQIETQDLRQIHEAMKGCYSW